MNINFNYQDQDKSVVVSMKYWFWRHEEILKDIDAVKHILDSLKDRERAFKENEK